MTTEEARGLVSYVREEVSAATSGVDDISATVITVGAGSAVVHLPTDPVGTDITVQNPNEISLEIGDQVFVHKLNGNINNAYILFRKTINFDDIYADYATGTDAFGRDNNGNLYGSVNAPFKTLQYAINRLPKNLNGRYITIYFGTLDITEQIAINNFHSGIISIEPSLEYYTGYAGVNRIYIGDCSGNYISVNYLDITRTDYWAVQVYRASTVNFEYCTLHNSGSDGGFFISTGSKVRIQDCGTGNRTIGIRAELLSEMYSADNYGTNSIYGLVADACSTIGKSGTQPTGSTANESASAGSVIR